jgi:hypothetical protein
MKARSAQVYAHWANTLKQHLSNAFSNIRFNVVGSRGDDSFKRTSDLDFQICFGGGQTTRDTIYGRVITELTNRTRGKTISNETVNRIELGGSNNVINVFIHLEEGKSALLWNPAINSNIFFGGKYYHSNYRIVIGT